MQIPDSVTIVTGASSGIGLATARLFARSGARVALVARSAEVLEQEASALRRRGLEARAFPADMRERAAVDALVARVLDRYGRIDIAINNAGQAMAGPIDRLDEAAFRRILDLNLFGPLYLIQAVVPTMRKQGGGVIVNVSSMVTKLDIPTLGGYSATKYALNSLSHTARIELAPDNIRVLTMYPGQTNTAFYKNYVGERREEATSPHRRGDTPEQVARKIRQAARAEPRDQYMGPGSHVLGLLHELVPGLLDKGMARMAGRMRGPGGRGGNGPAP